MSGDGFAHGPQVFLSTPSVGSSDGPAGNSPESLEASLDRINVHIPTSEVELLEGYGVCGRCSGTGRITGTGERAGRSVDCPRCAGTGAKGGAK